MECVTIVVQTSQKQLQQLATQIVLQHVPKESGMITLLHLHALAMNAPAQIIIILVHLLDWDTVIQVHINQVLMQPTVQESVPDVLLMVYLQQPIAGQQQLLQHVQLLDQQNVPIVAKQKHFHHLVMHLVRPQLVQLHKHVHVQVVVQQLLLHLATPGQTHAIPHVTAIVRIQEL